jgi:ankyrin repeat protein
MTPHEAAAALGVRLLTKVRPHEVVTKPIHEYDKSWEHIKASIRSLGVIQSSLILALAYTGLVESVQYLLYRGANIETKSWHYCRTPLILAAEGGHENVVRLLLDEGAEINAADIWRITALSWATILGHEQVVRVLVKRGANLKIKSVAGKTAWDYAMDCKDEQTKGRLLEALNGYNQRSNFIETQCRTSFVWLPSIL